MTYEVSRVSLEWVMAHLQSRLLHESCHVWNESCHTWNESCHVGMSHGTEEWMSHGTYAVETPSWVMSHMKWVMSCWNESWHRLMIESCHIWKLGMSRWNESWRMTTRGLFVTSHTWNESRRTGMSHGTSAVGTPVWIMSHVKRVMSRWNESWHGRMNESRHVWNESCHVGMSHGTLMSHVTYAMSHVKWVMSRWNASLHRLINESCHMWNESWHRHIHESFHL